MSESNLSYIPLTERTITWTEFMKIDQKLLSNSDHSDDRYWETAHPLSIVNVDLLSRDYKDTDPCPYCFGKHHMGHDIDKFPRTKRNAIVACGLKFFDLLYCHYCGIQMDNVAQADRHYRTKCDSEYRESSWQHDVHEHKRTRIFVLNSDISDILNMELDPQRAWALIVMWNQSVGDSQERATARFLRMTYDHYIYFLLPLAKNFQSIMSYIARTAVLADNSESEYYSVERQLRRRSASRFDEIDQHIIPHAANLETVRLNVLTEMANKYE